MLNNTVSVQPAKRRGRPIDLNSALTRARTAFSTLPESVSRKEAIAKFQELGISKDTSAAYYSVIKRSTRSK